MIAFLSELDGVTRMENINPQHVDRELKVAVRRNLPMIPDMTIDMRPTFTVARYELVGISDGIAFYDRVIDAEEIT